MSKFIALALLFVSSVSFATVSQEEAMKVFRGIYLVDISNATHDRILFAIKPTGEIAIARVDGATEHGGTASFSVQTVTKEGATPSVPVGYVTINFSKEKLALTYQLRLFPHQKDGKLELQVIDAVATTNDGTDNETRLRRLFVRVLRRDSPNAQEQPVTVLN